MRAAVTAILLAAVAAPSAAQVATGTMGPLRPDQQRFRDLYEELVETNTTLSAGSCTEAAEKLAVRLRAAGLAPENVQVLTVPEKPKEGEYHYKDTRDTAFGPMTVQVDAYNTFGRKPAEPPKPIDPIPEIRAIWRLRNAMPVKFRAGDFNAKGNDVAVEELHLVHEGLALERPSQ